MSLKKQIMPTLNNTHGTPWDPSLLSPSCCDGAAVCVKMPNHPVSDFSVYISNMRSVTTLEMPGWYGTGQRLSVLPISYSLGPTSHPTNYLEQSLEVSKSTMYDICDHHLSFLHANN